MRRQVVDAVTVALWSSGHIIAVSGCTLIACLLGLLYMPIDLLSSMGLGSAFSVLCSLISNLTFTPALLLTFPIFFANCIKPCPSCRARSDGRGRFAALFVSGDDHAHGTSVYDDDDDDDDNNGIRNGSNRKTRAKNALVNESGNDSDDSMGESERLLAQSNQFGGKNIRESKWFKIGSFVTRYPWLVVLFVSAIGAGLAYPLSQTELSGGVMCLASFQQKQVSDYKEINKVFGGGK